MLDKDTILQNLKKINDIDELKNFYQEYLSKKGIINQEFKTFGKLSPEERKEKGAYLSSLKNNVENEFRNINQKFKLEEINKSLGKEVIDYGTPGKKLESGHYTLLSETRRRTEEIFRSMGFIIEYGDDIVNKYDNFYSLNIPSSHPATEMHDTFYFDQKEDNGENYVFRTHTSAMENKLIKKYGPCFKAIIPGKVYRYENIDASHDTMFRQLEGLVIDKNISIANLKQTCSDFLSAFFETDVKVRMRPSYFPFTEPGIEIDASCPICKGDGCSLCKKTGWIEILGAGMSHPNVLKEGGIDPEEYSGFAFGMGLTRLVAIKYGIKDIRLLTNGDLRFLKSF